MALHEVVLSTVTNYLEQNGAASICKQHAGPFTQAIVDAIVTSPEVISPLAGMNEETALAVIGRRVLSESQYCRAIGNEDRPEVIKRSAQNLLSTMCKDEPLPGLPNKDDPSIVEHVYLLPFVVEDKDTTVPK